MSDIAVLYTLETPGGDIVFNDGEIPSFDDIIFITDIRGIDDPPIRAPMDDKPRDDGGLDHDFFFGPMHLVFDVEFLVQSTLVDNQIQIIRNTQIAALRAALRSITKVAAPGTLTWTPAGESEVALTVRYEQTLETTGVEQKTGTFGLYSAASTPA